MNTAGRVVLLIVGLILGAIVLIGGLGWLWFHNNEQALRQGAEQADAEARRYAQNHEQSECAGEALRRADACADMACRIGNTLFMNTCLSQARSSAELCREVPAPGEILALSRWAVKQCAAAGRESACPAEIYSPIAEYCAGQQPVLP
ncbi:MAG: hypothetical protein HYV16_07305 [Gammaproteobacteria bacterium]|nr:hypothetical protein [Gammaproteobacteria bacterium]